MRHEYPFTANDFKLYLEGTPAHPWNKTAMAVFVTNFCDKYSQYTPKEVEGHFKVHLATLIRKYKKQQIAKDNAAAEEQSKKKSRKSTRKANVSASSPSTNAEADWPQLLEGRKKTVNSIPELRKHAWILDRLGSAGMSSDESSMELGVRLYRVKKKYWRAAELTPFLHTIDRVTAQTKSATTSKGSQKYFRLPGEGVSSEGGIVPGLPINFYDPAWLDNLRAQMRPAFDSLKIDPNAYPLVHDQATQT